jgi:hypothetical protein
MITKEIKKNYFSHKELGYEKNPSFREKKIITQTLINCSDEDPEWHKRKFVMTTWVEFTFSSFLEEEKREKTITIIEEIEEIIYL